MRAIRSWSTFCLPAMLLLWNVTAPVAAVAEKIPIIYSTDLFQPHDDPDDHVDLATLFALDEFEMLGIIVEDGQKQVTRPGEIPVRQMMQLTGRQVPCVVGLNPPLKSPDDPALDQPAACQLGVNLLLEKLRASDRKVTIFTTGSMRDVAAAFNRDPDLLRQKVSRIYMNIGNAAPQDSEYNVDLDVHAYVRILQSGLPVYWCPCFGAPYGTFWKFRQADVLETAPAGLQNYFLYALTMGTDWKATPRPDSADPLVYLTGDVDPAAKREVFQLDRNMWCTAPFFHAAGRQIVERAPGQWEAVPALQPADRVVTPFDFVPGRVTVDDRGRTTFQEGGQVADPQVIMAFKVLDAERYQAVMTSCLKELFRERVDVKATGATEPVLGLRAESLTLLPQSQPVIYVHVRNTSNAPYTGQVALQPPDSWRIVPARHDVQLAPNEEQRLSFSTAGASESPSNTYPVVISAASASGRVSRRQEIVVASAPYSRPTVDGDPSDWQDAVPVSFVVGGRKTMISTFWHRKTFSILVTVEDAALSLPGQQERFDAVQFALAPGGTAIDWTTAKTAARFEYLLVPAGDGNGTCYRLTTTDTQMSLVDEARPLEPLVYAPAELVVRRVDETTYYECSLPWDDMRQAIKPAEGREFCLSVLVHDPDGTGIRDWGEAAGLWESQRTARAWCNWQGVQWNDTPPMDSRTPWGLCSSRY